MSRAATRARPVAGAGLLQPVALGAIAVLVLNDHVLKEVFPGLVTGKLSDFAGLLFFPVFLQAGHEIALAATRRPWAPSRRVLSVAATLTAVVFALVKLGTPVTDLYEVGLGALQWPAHALAALASDRSAPGLVRVQVWTDPTDLVALPAVLGAWAFGIRHRSTPASGAEPPHLPGGP